MVSFIPSHDIHLGEVGLGYDAKGLSRPKNPLPTTALVQEDPHSSVIVFI
jgi:hypothetical protein